MAGWENVAFIHLCITQYISPPELVCLILTSRDLCETYGNPETYRAVAKSFFGPAVDGPRGHLSRRHRQKKGVWCVRTYICAGEPLIFGHAHANPDSHGMNGWRAVLSVLAARLRFHMARFLVLKNVLYERGRGGGGEKEKARTSLLRRVQYMFVCWLYPPS